MTVSDSIVLICQNAVKSLGVNIIDNGDSMAIERIMSGVLTDEDLELYSAAREVMHGAAIQATADAYGIDRLDIECLVEELVELEAHYAQMAIAAITDLRKE
jgi:hypothetical protein